MKKNLFYLFALICSMSLLPLVATTMILTTQKSLKKKLQVTIKEHWISNWTGLQLHPACQRILLYPKPEILL